MNTNPVLHTLLASAPATLLFAVGPSRCVFRRFWTVVLALVACGWCVSAAELELASALPNRLFSNTEGLTFGIDLDDQYRGQWNVHVTTDLTNVSIAVPTTTNRFASLNFVDSNGADIGSVVIEILEGPGGLAAERFINLATKGYNSAGQVVPNAAPYYTDVPVHRVLDLTGAGGWIIQTGDAQFGNGTGGSPLPDFDDQFDLQTGLNFSTRGMVAMANSGANTNDSQFFITDGPTTHLNGRHMIFGRVVSGRDTIDHIIALPTNSANARPITTPRLRSVAIVDAVATLQFNREVVPRAIVSVFATNNSGDSTAGSFVAATPVSEVSRIQLGSGDPGFGSVVDGTLLYIADGVRGLAIYSIANPAAPLFLGAFDTAGEARSVTVRDYSGVGKVAFVADKQGGLAILNVTNPANITLITIVPVATTAANLEGDAYDVAINDSGVAFVATSPRNSTFRGGLTAIDVSTPSNPRRLSSLSLVLGTAAVTMQQIILRGDTAYVTSDNAGLLELNVSGPSPLALANLLTRVPIQAAFQHPSGMAITGNHLLVTDIGTETTAGRLVIFDILNPPISVPNDVVRVLSLSRRPWQIAVDQGFAVIGHRDGGMRIFDVSSPATPILRFSSSSGIVGRPSIDSHFVYVPVTDGENQLHILRDEHLVDPRIAVLYGSSFIEHDKTSVDFGSVAEGQSPRTLLFSLKNDGAETLIVAGVTVPDGFTVHGPARMAVLPGQFGTLAIQLNSALAGPKNGSVEIMSNDFFAERFRFAITGVVTGNGTDNGVLRADAQYVPGQPFTVNAQIAYISKPLAVGFSLEIVRQDQSGNEVSANWAFIKEDTFPIEPVDDGSTIQPFQFAFINVPNSPINRAIRFTVPNDADGPVTIRGTLYLNAAGTGLPSSAPFNTLTIVPSGRPAVTPVTPANSFLTEANVAAIAASAVNSISAGQSITFTANVAPADGQPLARTFFTVATPEYTNGRWNEGGSVFDWPIFRAFGNIDVPFAATSPVSGDGHTFAWTQVASEMEGNRSFTWTPGVETITNDTPLSERLFLAEIWAEQDDGTLANAAWMVVVNPVLITGTPSAPSVYAPGQNFTVSVQTLYESRPLSLGLTMEIFSYDENNNEMSAGWSFVSASGGPPDFIVEPEAGAVAQPFAFAFLTVPSSPIPMAFTYFVPAGFSQTVIIESTLMGTTSVANGGIPFGVPLTRIVVAPNTRPVMANPIHLNIQESGDIQFDLKTVAADANGDAMTFSIIPQGTTRGSLTVHPVTGILAYNVNQPGLAQGESVVDIFSVTASDAFGASNPQTLSITITGVNDPPSAENLAGLRSAPNHIHPVNFTEITLVGDDIDNDNSPSDLAFRITSGFALGVIKDRSGNDLGLESLIVPEMQPIRFFPNPGIVGEIELDYRAIDRHQTESAPATIGIVVAVPWFPSIDLAAFDPSAAVGGIYRISIQSINGTGSVSALLSVRTSPTKAVVEPHDYLLAGVNGLPPGTYSVTVYTFVFSEFQQLGDVLQLVTDEYAVPTVVNVPAVDNPSGSHGLFDFAFSLESVSGYLLEIVHPNAASTHILRDLQPAADGSVSAGGTFVERGINLLQSGTYSWSITPFNPNGEGGTVTQNFTLQPADVEVPDAIPGGVSAFTMHPGSLDEVNPAVIGTASIMNGQVFLPSVTLQWDHVPLATGYRVRITSVDGEPFGDNVEMGGPTFATISLPPGVYSWQVTAFNAVGSAAPSPPRYFRIDSLNVDFILVKPGWNLISVSEDMVDRSVDGILGNRYVGSVWGWHSGGYQALIGADLLLETKAYWAYCREPATLYVEIDVP